uniref:Uncharacterized protein n=1 Tax=Anguilla anguilla TaxID=7936 RepID=A0A0E9RW03_ANGAN
MIQLVCSSTVCHCYSKSSDHCLKIFHTHTSSNQRREEVLRAGW